MTISELITQLQKLQALHGDLPVTRPDWTEYGFKYFELITEVHVSDEKYTIGTIDAPGPHIHLS